MNLHGSINELQSKISQLYLDIEQHFSENNLIRELWGAMAQDISQQTHSLNALPISFWQQLKKDQDGLLEAIHSARQYQVAEKTEDRSIRGCFERTLRIEEPTILKIYAPIIRSLRENWTDKALDFYITVKAHLARITRVTEAFSGDPIIIQRSNLLLFNFEKEVQEPQIEIKLPIKKAKTVQPVTARKKPEKRHRKAQKRASSLIKRAKNRQNRTKSLVAKVTLHRRRARR